ncbi:MAG TPA: HIT family protein [Paenibacillaceae bacterium]|nr:HIT family protein [Paenibacillaceae bacterium]
MAHDPNCIFCKIIQGDIPSAKVYEDEHILAFIDISQVTEGHTLIIPKEHKQDIFALTPEIAQNLFKALPMLANGIKAAFNPLGLNIVNNNGEAAGQTVFHYHVHLIPRYGKQDGFSAKWANNMDKYTAENYQAIAGKIKEQL